ncbi:hypothetical protein FEK35_16700 [Nocardia cyriacigeorgica]|uniref:Uncharacterized protein n=1 Tax=Nocardia cyriacigeorgica TaxID=135487 RepID=A0A5R8PD29_9NOCA|nr:hypothetical protein FEK35_16700 [Nocardia cyriacigeorgica]
MSRNTHFHSRTRRTLARVAVASLLTLAPITAFAVPALAAPVALGPAEGIDAVERPGHGRHGQGDGRGHGGHGSWNRGHDHDHDRNRSGHDRPDWDRGHDGRGRFPLPSTGSAL